MQCIHDCFPEDPEADLPSMPPSANNAESDSDFLLKLSHDSMCVARKKQMHSTNHSATCFKYRQRRSGKDTCRFGMPRDLLSESKVDDLGIIHLTRNNGWVNSWNPAIASCIRSNHDISWIPTKSKSLSLMYYITNYATKDDISPSHMLAKAALLRQSIDQARTVDSPTAKDLRLRENGMDNFALRSFNALSQDREISGVQVASTCDHRRFFHRPMLIYQLIFHSAHSYRSFRSQRSHQHFKRTR